MGRPARSYVLVCLPPRWSARSSDEPLGQGRRHASSCRASTAQPNAAQSRLPRRKSIASPMTSLWTMWRALRCHDSGGATAPSRPHESSPQPKVLVQSRKQLTVCDPHRCRRLQVLSKSSLKLPGVRRSAPGPSRVDSPQNSAPMALTCRPTLQASHVP